MTAEAGVDEPIDLLADPDGSRLRSRLERTGLAMIRLGQDVLPLCDEAAADAEPWFSRPGVRRVQDLWRRSRAVRTLAGWPPALEGLRRAFGREPFAFQTLNFRQGSEQPPHSDAAHFHSDPQGFMCGLWIALEDVKPEAGPLVYYPESHRLPWPDQDRASAQDEHGSVSSDWLARHGYEARRATPAKGEAVIWAANLVHGGAPVVDPAMTRRSLVVHYYFHGCAYWTPIASNFDPARKKLRLPVDVRTGRPVWPERDGRRLPVRPQAVADFWLRSAARKVLAL